MFSLQVRMCVCGRGGGVGRVNYSLNRHATHTELMLWSMPVKCNLNTYDGYIKGTSLIRSIPAVLATQKVHKITSESKTPL